MRMDPAVKSRIVRDALLSLPIYALPPLMMLASLSLRGDPSWRHPVAVHPSGWFWKIDGWSHGHGVTAFILLWGAAEFALGRYGSHWNDNESKLDIFCTALQKVVIAPFFAWISPHVLPVILPSEKGLFSWVPFFWSIVILCVTDDLTVYWYHRLHHEIPCLWRFHRTHHSASYMGVAMANRQNIFHVMFFSKTYMTILLVYLGLGPAAVVLHTAKSLNTALSHTNILWDKPLYDHKWLHPLAWVLERLILLPATHHAHHAAVTDDGVGFYKGNFASMLFVWDVLFGTALISRRYPSAYGISHYEGDPWYAQVFWPVLKSNIPGSELAADGPEVRTDDDLGGALPAPAAGD